MQPFPGNNSYPGYQHGYPQQQQIHPTTGLTMPPDLALVAQQGYQAQQAQLAAMQQQQQQQQQQQLLQQQHQQVAPPQQQRTAQPGPLERMQMQAYANMPNPAANYKPKTGPGSKRAQHQARMAAQQSLSRHTSHLNPPTHPETYRGNAMNPPAPFEQPIEPWADALDEVDHRELAMGRFRARQEVMAEVFGPERIKDIPLASGDAWEGLGMSGETLEAKVLALEKENEELERKMRDTSNGSAITA